MFEQSVGFDLNLNHTFFQNKETDIFL